MLTLSDTQYDRLAQSRRAQFLDRLETSLRRTLPLEAHTTPALFARAALDRSVARVEAAGLHEEVHVAAFVRLAIERFGGDADACLRQPGVLAAQAELEDVPGAGADLRFRRLFDAAGGLGAAMGRPRPLPPPLPPLRQPKMPRPN